MANRQLDPLAPNPEVYQHNNLIRSSLRMGELEAQIFVRALACVRQSKDPNEPLPPIKIRLTDLVGSGKANAKTYEQIRQACRAIFDQELHLVSVKSQAKRADYWSRLVTDIGISEGTGYITGYFNPRIQPFLQGLIKAAGGEGEFTFAYLAVLLTLRNPHSQRMYWLLKSWQQLGSKQYRIEELKLLLFGVGAVDKNGKDTGAKDPYPNWADFARFVLKPVEKELANIEFPITVTPVKTGKKVTGVHFGLPPVDAKPRNGIQAALALPPAAAGPAQPGAPTAAGAPVLLPKFGQVYRALAQVWRLADWQLAALTTAVAGNEIKLGKVQDVMRILNVEKATVDNLPAVLWTRLKKEFPSLNKG